MKRFLLVFALFPFAAHSANWTNYPFGQPVVTDTFLFGTSVTNRQITYTNFLLNLKTNLNFKSASDTNLNLASITNFPAVISLVTTQNNSGLILVPTVTNIVSGQTQIQYQMFVTNVYYKYGTNPAVYPHVTNGVATWTTNL